MINHYHMQLTRISRNISTSCGQTFSDNIFHVLCVITVRDHCLISEGIVVNCFTKISLILEVKFGEDPLCWFDNCPQKGCVFNGFGCFFGDACSNVLP